jgi:23S rRNA pseudouridine1911/1915/1917 synthase
MRVKTPEIIYEDSDLLVCRKEAGVAVQTARPGQADMVSLLKNYRAKKKEEPYIGLIHRLDQPVEGVMVFAKNQKAAASLSKQVSGRQMEKQYLAVLQGIPKERTGELRDFLLKDGRTNTSSVVSADTPGAKEARLSYEVLKTEESVNKALVRIRLHTGRHHQIRVQFSHAGYPLYGDTKYGQPLLDGVYCPVALCSCRIGFVHPSTKKEMEFEIQPTGKAFGDFFV